MESQADQEFIGMCRQKAAQGVKLLRVHVVEKPFTPYVSWEIEFYKVVNQRLAGESVFLVDKNDIQNTDLPGGDLMIFDRQKAVVNAYDCHGRVMAETFYDKPNELKPLLEIRDKIVRIAKPLNA